MKPFDDSIPEETEAQHLELVTMLQHTYTKPVPLAPNEQEQIIAQVRERLLRIDQVDTQNEDSSSMQVGIADSTLRPSVAFPGKTRSAGKIMRLVNTFAAVLVIGAIIGASVLLFTRHPSTSTTPTVPAVGPVDTPVTVHTERDGLEASMSLTPGPYFLSEMLAADLSLTNHSHTTYSLGGADVESLCGSALNIDVTGGSAPYYTPPPMFYPPIACPLTMTILKPGQTIHLRQYLPLIASGHVTLTEGALCLVKVNGSGTTNGPCPLDGYWPSIHINVNSRVPSDRMISFHRSGSHVFVDAPGGARSRLLYLYSVTCQDFRDQGGSGTGNFIWEPIPTNEVKEPGCPGKNVKWTFAFSAVGYSIVSGSYPAH